MSRRESVPLVISYQGSATIRQGAAATEGECFVESPGDARPGPDSAWSGRLSGPAPKLDLNEGPAWLSLQDGREGEIQITRAVAGSGLVEFEGIGSLNALH